MVNSPYFELFQKDSVDKRLKIEFDGGVITNEELHQQQFELTESLCSESELRFGSCEANSIKFKISNVFIPLKDKWLTVSMTLNGSKEPFLIGRYKVYSDVPTADRKFRDVVAYDAMCDIINTDVVEWYNAVLPNEDSKTTLKDFRTRFIRHFGLEQEYADLVNDDMIVEKTIQPEEISGKDVIAAICEINGCFGHIGRNGKFKWIYLPQLIQGLYPANGLYPDHAPDYLPYQQETGHLYPQDPKSSKIGKILYISCSYEDFITKEIKKLQIRQEENDIGAIVGTDGNTYIIEDNFLVYGKSASELNIIANNILGKIKGIIYRPFEADCKGNLCLEAGDPIRLSTKYKIIESYILQRNLKGIQALRDNYSAEGALEYTEKVNSVQKSIIQLKGKTNKLIRNVDETRLEMENIEEGLKNEISITAEGLQANIDKEQQRAEGAEEILSNSIQITAEGLTADITAERKRAEGAEENLSTSVSVTAEGLAAEVKRATENEENLSASLSITAGKVESKVGKGEVSSEISQEPDKVVIRSNRLVVESNQFKLTEKGDATFSGNLQAATGSFSGDVTSDNGSHYATISNGQFKGGNSSLGEETGYVSFNTTNQSGVYGAKVGGKGILSLISPVLATSQEWRGPNEGGNVWAGQTGKLKVITYVQINEDGTWFSTSEELNFVNGLMVTAI